MVDIDRCEMKSSREKKETKHTGTHGITMRINLLAYAVWVMREVHVAPARCENIHTLKKGKKRRRIKGARNNVMFVCVFCQGLVELPGKYKNAICNLRS
jgi:hypothetical protein